jgi:hypothetical protein
MDMPLVSILHFQETGLPKPPDEMVDEMLQKAHQLEI